MLDLNLILWPKILATKLIEVLDYNFIYNLMVRIFKYIIIFILLSKVVDLDYN